MQLSLCYCYKFFLQVLIFLLGFLVGVFRRSLLGYSLKEQEIGAHQKVGSPFLSA